MKKYLFILLATAALFISCSDDDNDDDNQSEVPQASAEELREQTISARRSQINEAMSNYCAEIGKLGEDIHSCASKTFKDAELEMCGTQIEDVYVEFYELARICVSYCSSYVGTEELPKCLSEEVLCRTGNNCTYSGSGNHFVDDSMTSGGLLESCYAQNNLGESMYVEMKKFLETK